MAETLSAPMPRRTPFLALSVQAVALALVFTPLAANPVLADAVSLPAPQVPGFADVVDAVTPAVVSVKVQSELAANRGWRYRFDRRLEDEDDFFGQHPFFRQGGPRMEDEERPFDRHGGERGADRFGVNQGSGFLVSEDGYIVTNHHVIENGSKFTVVLSDGSELEATLVGADARTDLAVLKVADARKFTYVKFSTDPVRVGEWVVAVGNPFGLGGSVTAGIVSAHNRALRTNRYDEFLQIDAAVNRGNSGGPAFNLKGEVIGVNNQILSPTGGNVGIAFAIPAGTASEIVTDLIANGQVVRGWLGVQIQPVTQDIAESVALAKPGGAIVTDPQAGSPAAIAGIKAGDVITAVNGQAIDNPRTLVRLISEIEPESKVKIAIWRNGAASEIEVTLGKLDEASLQEGGGEGGRGRARLGLQVEPAPDGSGLVVVDVIAGSPAAEKGMRAGDVILTINGEKPADPKMLRELVRKAADAGRPSALLQIRRDAEVRFLAIPLGRG